MTRADLVALLAALDHLPLTDHRRLLAEGIGVGALRVVEAKERGRRRRRRVAAA
jgi:hypothetical protein